jgi:hypothetical protein
VKKTGAVLDSILRNLGLESGVRLARIRSDWYEMFDEQVTSQLFPSTLSGKELLLHVSSPIWMQQFSYHKDQILKKLNAYGVQSIRFRLGKIPPGKQRPVVPCKVTEITSEQRLYIEELLKDIQDENLKEAAKKAIEKSLTSAKH